MIRPVIITSSGKVEIYTTPTFNLSSFKKLKKTIDSWKLQPQRMLMSEKDYKDLIEYFGG